MDCTCCRSTATHIIYILYPMDILESWIENAVCRYQASIVIITGMDWQNVFSPWPATGVPKGTPDFKGESPQFLEILRGKVIPIIEAQLGINTDVQRTLVGVSMSGLFTLWQWMLCNCFKNIISLSGSFWYEGFMDWFNNIAIPAKAGLACFLLGDKETKSGVKTFNTVGANTEKIVATLISVGIDSQFLRVPGDHYADPIPRLEKSLSALFHMRNSTIPT